MRGQEAEQCGHRGDVGVECNTPDTSQCSEHVLYNVSAYVRQFLIVNRIKLPMHDLYR